VAGGRDHQISRWLELNSDVTRHAVIDDDHDMAPGLVPFFTDTRTGITDEIVAAVSAYLGPGYEHIDLDGGCVDCGRERSMHDDPGHASAHGFRAPAINRGHDPILVG
jgi:hypothetical protein